MDGSIPTSTNNKTSNKIWLFYAFSGFFIIGICNYLLSIITFISALNTDDIINFNLKTYHIYVSIISVIFCYLGCLMFVVIFSGYRYLYNRFYNLDIDIFSLYNDNNNNANRPSTTKFIVLSTVAGLLLGIGMFTLKFGLSSIDAHTNKGPLLSLVACNSIVVSVYSYLHLKEIVKFVQVLGIITAIIGISIISFSGGGEGELMGIVYGLLTAICFGSTNSILKFLSTKNANSKTLVSLTLLGTGYLGIFGSPILVIFLNKLSTYSLSISESVFYESIPLLGIFAGILLSIGILCIALGVAVGIAGGVTAITGSSSIVVLVLELFFYPKLSIATGKIIGMVVCIFGVILISLGNTIPVRNFVDTIYSKLICSKQTKKNAFSSSLTPISDTPTTVIELN